MPLADNHVQQLIINPVESLSLELKDWIDPNTK